MYKKGGHGAGLHFIVSITQCQCVSAKMTPHYTLQTQLYAMSKHNCCKSGNREKISREGFGKEQRFGWSVEMEGWEMIFAGDRCDRYVPME